MLIVLLIIGGTIAMLLRFSPPARSGPHLASEYAQMTNFTDAAFSPALSADGRMLTFIRGSRAGTIGGAGEIYVKVLPDGDAIQLTRDGKQKMSPVFMPAGDRIVYGVPAPMTELKNWSTWSVSVFGGEPKLVFTNASGLTWLSALVSPQIMFSTVDRDTHMSVVTSLENGTEPRTVYAPQSPGGMAHRAYPLAQWQECAGRGDGSGLVAVPFGTVPTYG